MRAAVVQMNSTADVDGNLTAAERLVRAAAADGAELVVLPEKWPLLASGAELEAAAQEVGGPIMSAARGWARELGIELLAGSVTERAADGGAPYNASTLIGRDGTPLATYRKLHMFDVDVDGVSYRESEHERAGEEIVCAPLSAAGAPDLAEELTLGMTICYDLRFPELYRILALRGATAFSVPSAFTATTGRAHWEVLLRARAIENACFVLAAAQYGRAAPHYESHGHAMIVDPWGTVVGGLGAQGEGFACAELDLEAQARVRESLPALANRRPDAYRWPERVSA